MFKKNILKKMEEFAMFRLNILLILIISTISLQASIVTQDSDLKPVFQQGHGSTYVSGVAYSKDGTLLASSDGALFTKVWNVKSKKLIATFKEEDGLMKPLYFSDDNRYLYMGTSMAVMNASFDRKPRIRIWDLKTKKSAGYYNNLDNLMSCKPEYVEKYGSYLLDFDPANETFLIGCPTNVGIFSPTEGFIKKIPLIEEFKKIDADFISGKGSSKFLNSDEIILRTQNSWIIYNYKEGQFKEDFLPKRIHQLWVSKNGNNYFAIIKQEQLKEEITPGFSLPTGVTKFTAEIKLNGVVKEKEFSAYRIENVEFSQDNKLLISTSLSVNTKKNGDGEFIVYDFLNDISSSYVSKYSINKAVFDPTDSSIITVGTGRYVGYGWGEYPILTYKLENNKFKEINKYKFENPWITYSVNEKNNLIQINNKVIDLKTGKKVFSGKDGEKETLLLNDSSLLITLEKVKNEKDKKIIKVIDINNKNRECELKIDMPDNNNIIKYSQYYNIIDNKSKSIYWFSNDGSKTTVINQINIEKCELKTKKLDYKSDVKISFIENNLYVKDKNSSKSMLIEKDTLNLVEVPVENKTKDNLNIDKEIFTQDQLNQIKFHYVLSENKKYMMTYENENIIIYNNQMKKLKIEKLDLKTTKENEYSIKTYKENLANSPIEYLKIFNDGKYLILLNSSHGKDKVLISEIKKDSNYVVEGLMINEVTNVVKDKKNNLYFPSIFGLFYLNNKTVRNIAAFEDTEKISYIKKIDMVVGSFGKELRFIRDGETKLTITQGATDLQYSVPDGRYDIKDTLGLMFSIGTELYDAEQFFTYFYTPGLYKMVMDDKLPLIEPSVISNIDTDLIPYIKILNEKKTVANNNKFLFKFKIGNHSNLKEFLIFQNGKNIIKDKRALMLKKEKNKLAYYEFPISLTNGENEISIYAVNKNNIESAKQKISVFYQGKDLIKKPNLYLVSIGINKYKNKKLNLNYAKADAEGFSKIFKKQKLFETILSYDLYDKEATRENVHKTLQKIADKIKPDDIFIMYYAGHGTNIENTFYLVTTENTRLYSEKHIKKNSVSYDDIKQYLSKISALKQVVMLDACQAGTALQGYGVRGAAEEKALAQLSRSTGVHIISATTSEQYATEFDELKHGVFTYAVLKGFSGKADTMPADGKITIREIITYIENQIPELTEKYKGEAQYPITFSFGQDFPIILTKNK